MTKRKSATAKAADPATAGTLRNEQRSRKPKTKLAQLEAMLRRPNGATIEQISKLENSGPVPGFPLSGKGRTKHWACNESLSIYAKLGVSRDEIEGWPPR
jgi:hypothetical protein